MDPPGSPLTIAYYVTPHGLGHATRSLEVARLLLSKGHTVVLASGNFVGRFFQKQLQRAELARFTFRKVVLDSGALQPHAFMVDMALSLKQYYQLADGEQRQGRIESESMWLVSNEVDVVVSDVVPLACSAARAVGVPAICVSNFSWDFIFAEYVANNPVDAEYQEMVKNIAEDYACADTLLRLPGFTPMPAFPRSVDVPMVVRPIRHTPEQTRDQFFIPPDCHLVTFMFGAHALTLEPQEGWLPPGWMCIVCSGGNKLTESGELPGNFVMAPADAYVPDLINASDAVIGKIGYGSVSECLSTNTPLLFVRRDHFNEEPFLRQLLLQHGAALEMPRAALTQGNWAPFLEAALRAEVDYPFSCDGAEVAANYIACAPNDPLQISRKISLTPNISFGYMMHGVGGLEPFTVPAAISPTSAGAATLGSQHGGMASAFETDRAISELFHITHLPSCSDPVARADTDQYLRGLAKMAALDPTRGIQPGTSTMGRALPEERATGTLFLWDEPIVVARAPGRLDVMGGISDYSGALVLQMPTALACHVGVQVQPVSRHRLWNHMRKRHDAEPGPVIRVVSMHADRSNRAPANDIFVSDLERDGVPLPYNEVREMLAAEPSRSWSAYVLGCFLVLMHEHGVRLRDSFAVHVQSAVPEGGGVSSSAALEVATMQAICIVLKLQMEGLEIARLCQMVENQVVGAPCGIMDQLASALGRKDELLAIRCRPAEVVGSFRIPSHLCFVGIESGIQHRVGGSEYTNVRVAAFMGLRIINDNAKRPVSKGSLATESFDYLCSIPPSGWESRWESQLPERMTGGDFLKHYGSHIDPITSVSELTRYPVRAATRHPIMENLRARVFQQLLLSPEISAPIAADIARSSILTSTVFASATLPFALTGKLFDSAEIEADTAGLGTYGGDRDRAFDVAELMGELMLQSHASYSGVKLGSVGTDTLVRLAQQFRPAAQPVGMGGIFGARVTGGGAGGTVCMLASADAAGQEAVQQLVAEYTKEAGHAPTVVQESSSGAAQFGHMVVQLKATREDAG